MSGYVPGQSSFYLAFNGVNLSPYFRTFSDNEDTSVFDATAGNVGVRTYVPVFNDGKASAEFVDQSSGTTIWAALVKKTIYTLEWGPRGTAGGNPRHYVSAMLLNRSRTFPYNDLAIIKADWQFTGDVTDTTY